MQIEPTFYHGSAPFAASILPQDCATLLVTVDGAERGPCAASIDPPVESTKFSMSAHVDSFSSVLVLVKNESGETLSLEGLVNVVCVEWATAPQVE